MTAFGIFLYHTKKARCPASGADRKSQEKREKETHLLSRRPGVKQPEADAARPHRPLAGVFSGYNDSGYE